MKRNIELVRLLLLRFEGNEDAAAECAKFSDRERAYHAQLMVDAGLIEAIIVKGPDGEISGSIVSRLTWAGHDFIDATRDDSLWQKAKEKVLKPGASWTFDLLKEWAKQEIKSRIGLV